MVIEVMGMTLQMKNYNNGFTLIEMLAVLFIIGIIFSLTLPAFGPMMRALKLNTAAENLVNTLETARQYAITSGVYCAVVFPTTGDYAYSSYKICEFNEDKEPVKFIGKLETLPKGISIDPKKTKFMNQTKSISFPEEGSGPVQVKYLLFKPNGSGYTGGNVYLLDSDSGDFRKITVSPSPVKVRIYDINEDPNEE